MATGLAQPLPICTTETRRDRIAVIGAGVAGIVTIVSLKEEGFEPVCYEASDSHGGLWNYKEESVEGFASLMPTTVFNSSKEMGAFSNFPPDKEYSNHMHHRKFFQYLTEYYNHNECGKYVRLNTEVTNVKKAEDYESTGRLSVTVKDRISKEVSTYTFDGVIVANGHRGYPKMAEFPGLEKFKGEVIHTHSLKHVDKYKDKNVLVIGTGSSGLDAAEVTSYWATQVYLSCRNGNHVIQRLGLRGYPVDYVSVRRYMHCNLNSLTAGLMNWYAETYFIDSYFDQNLYYVKPKYHVFSKDPTINDALYPKLLSGLIRQKGAVERFTETGVVFVGDDTATEIDAVILGTGYTFKFPFLEAGLLQVVDGRIDLYKTVFPAQLPHPSLAFIGFLNPFGPAVPIVELQARWVTRVFAGKTSLPSSKDMLKDSMERHEKNKHRYVPSEFTSIQVDADRYMDNIARKIGCKPDLRKYLFKDFPLFLKLSFGPIVPYQYRLDGPHKWEGAREAIMTVDDRVLWPLSRENRSGRGWMQYICEYLGNLVPRNVFIP